MPAKTSKPSTHPPLINLALPGLVGTLLLVLSFVVWQVQQARILAAIKTSTETHANYHAYEVTFRYTAIKNALERLAQNDDLRSTTSAEQWEQDTRFYIDSFPGLNSIAWVDSSYRLRLINPLQGHENFLGQTAGRGTWDPLELKLWVPIYHDLLFNGYLVGSINLDDLMAAVLSGNPDEHILQLSNEDNILYASADWAERRPGFTFEKTIQLPNAAVLHLALAPSEKVFARELSSATATLIFSLLISVVATIALFYAQSFYALSKLNALRFEQTLASMQEGCAILSFKWHFLFINEAAAGPLGRMSGKMLGKSIYDCFPGLQNEEFYPLLECCMKERLPQKTILPIQTADGQDCWYELSFQPAPDGILILSNDVSERIRNQQEILDLNTELESRIALRTRELEAVQAQLVRQESLTALGRLAGGMGHELRNPLGVITNAAYYLKLIQPEAEGKVRDYLEIIEKESRIAGKIISDLLDYAQTRSPHRQDVTVQEMVARTLEMYPVPDNVHVILNLPSMPRLYADRRQVEQVLCNLVSNACQAMSTGGTLIISALQEGKELVIRVQDTGIGIHPEHIGRIFEPLFSTKTKGIGLGLAVSRKLVEANGGRIEVHSQPGLGATLTVYLPTAEANHG